MTRFVVKELEGYATIEDQRRGSKSLPGLSCIVQDSAFNYRVMAEYRLEDLRYLNIDQRFLSREERLTILRSIAARKAHDLEARCG